MSKLDPGYSWGEIKGELEKLSALASINHKVIS
jgi:hypothetical protein